MSGISPRRRRDGRPDVFAQVEQAGHRSRLAVPATQPDHRDKLGDDDLAVNLAQGSSGLPGDRGRNIGRAAGAAMPAAPRRAAVAGRDLVEGLRRYWMWTALAMQDIRLRYRGSVLGPF